LFSAQYRTFAARMKIPAGAGLWPALWMVGDTGSWPASGEIDVMEAVGQSPFTVSGTVHGPSQTSSTGYALGHKFIAPTALTSGFHVYGITWTPTSISWTVDGRVYATTTPLDLLPAGAGRSTSPSISSSTWPSTGTGPAPNAATPFPWCARRLGARVSVGRRFSALVVPPLRNQPAEADYMSDERSSCP
jgi:beta-glucanase (GH16 family)